MSRSIVRQLRVRARFQHSFRELLAMAAGRIPVPRNEPVIRQYLGYLKKKEAR